MSDLKIRGITYKQVENVIDKFLIGLRETNPMLLNMYKDRNKKPYLDLNPWSGEFVGKYLTSCYYSYKLTGNEKLKTYALNVIKEIITYQDTDGYLGVFSDEAKLTGANSFDPTTKGITWDSWNHYHAMFGLYLWYKETGNKEYLNTIVRIADLYINTFYINGRTLSDMGYTEMNLAVYHMFGVLYNELKEKKYLDFAKKVEEDMKSQDNAEDYLGVGLSKTPFYKCKKPRWESLHPMMGFIEMYKATNDKKYLDSISFTVNSIIETDCHNTGGFSTKEQAIGNPYTNGPIETCCVVAFDALVNMLYKLEPKVEYIDLLEKAHYNAMLGAHHKTGAMSTYDTPMAGYKVTSQVFNNFQVRAGSHSLNCCSVNAPRGISQIVDWMIYENDEYVYINSYEKSSYNSSYTSLKIVGQFPLKNKIKISIDKCSKPIKIRIPSWSAKTKLLIDGNKVDATTGKYYTINNCSTIELVLDYKLRFEKGDIDYKGKTCVFYGPILLAYDRTINDLELTPMKKSDFRPFKAMIENDCLLLKLKNGLILTDFYNAGQAGNYYTTWLEITK